MSAPNDFDSLFASAGGKAHPARPFSDPRGGDSRPGDSRPGEARPGEVRSIDDAARAIWRRARVRPETIDFDRLDRSVLRAVADERLRRDEARRVRRVLWPGVAFAGALAAAGVLWVTVFEGDQTMVPSAAHATAAIATGAGELQPGDAFAAARSKQTLRVSQATMIAEVGASGRVLEASDVNTRIALDAGAARFEVGPRSERAVFTVEAGRVAISVIGTSFRVERIGESVDVSVLRGRVAIARDGAFLSTLTDGEHLLVDPPASAVSEGPPRASEPRVRTAPTPADVALLAAAAAESARSPAAAANVAVGDAAQGGPGHSTAATAPTATAASESVPPATTARAVEPPRAVRPARPSSKDRLLEAALPAPASAATVSPSAPIMPPAPKVPPAAVQAPPVAAVSLDLSEDDRLATLALRALVSGLNDDACFERLSDIRAWIADNTDHGRVRTAQHALAYCYHALGRPADADRLFRHLGFKLKDILDPQPPRM